MPVGRRDSLRHLINVTEARCSRFAFTSSPKRLSLRGVAISPLGSRALRASCVHGGPQSYWLIAIKHARLRRTTFLGTAGPRFARGLMRSPVRPLAFDAAIPSCLASPARARCAALDRTPRAHSHVAEVLAPNPHLSARVEPYRIPIALEYRCSQHSTERAVVLRVRDEAVDGDASAYAHSRGARLRSSP